LKHTIKKTAWNNNVISQYSYFIMNRIFSFLNSKPGSLIIIVFAIAERIINVLYVSFAGRDKMLLVLQSKSLLDGKGLSIPQYFTNNLETPVYDFTPFWPPGYPVLLAPLLKIFNYDVYWSTTIFDIIVSIAFIFLVRKIALQLNFPLAAANILTLIAGCFEYPFIYESLPTDTISLVFFLTGLLFVLQIAVSEKFLWGKLLLAAFFLFLPYVFRYSYPPLSAAVPLGIIILGLMNRNRLLVKKGIWVFIITAALIAVFTIFLNATTGSAGYILKTERGLFPENLIHWHPFVTASFINLPFLTSQANKIAGLSLNQTLTILEIINAIIVFVIIALFLYLLFKKKFFLSPDKFNIYLFLGFIISAATCLSLGYLSFTYQIQNLFQHSWNYIGESRYYAFIHVFLQTVFVGWVFLYPAAWKKSLFQKAIIFIFAALFFIEVVHNIYFNTKVAFNFREYKSTHYKELDFAYFNSLIDSVIKKNPDADIVVASDNDHFNPYTAAFLDKKGIFDGVNLNRILPKVKKRTILLVALYDYELPAYNAFLSNNNVKFLNRVLSSNYYMIELSP